MSELFFIDPPALPAMRAARLAVNRFGYAPKEPMRLLPGGIAQIDVFGALTTESYRVLSAALDKAAQTDRAKGVALFLDSPGGDIACLLDLTDKIFELRKSKPVAAICAETALSAAYVLASACSKIYIPDTGVVGSIGVVSTHVSSEKALEKAGYEITILYAGAHKVLGNPYQDLSPAAKEKLSADVSFFYEKLISAIGKYRPQLGKGGARKTEAATFIGDRAISAGLADKIAWPREAIADFSSQLNLPAATGGRNEKAMTTAICVSQQATAQPKTAAPTGIQQASEKRISRASFDALSPVEKRAFCLKGGRLYDTEKKTGKSAIC